MEKLVIFGSGGHSKVVCDIVLEDRQFEILGLLSKDKKKIYNIPVIGDDEFFFEKFNNQKQKIKVFVAIGDNILRKKITERLKRENYRLANIISRKSIISKNVKLGNGVVIMKGAVIETESIIGNGVIINTNASINHECKIGDFSHIAPGVNLAGNVEIGECTLVGVGSSIIPKIKIGKFSIVGAGSVVVDDVLDFSVYYGNPARFRKKIKINF